MKRLSEDYKLTYTILVGLIVSLVLVVFVMWLNRGDGRSYQISTFEQCREAGGNMAESYPEQCYIEGNSFTNPDQEIGEPLTDKPTQNDLDSAKLYTGLSESEAYSKAEGEGKVARVFSVDGENQPVTMDFMPGRLNLHMVDGLVGSVSVEGE